MTPVEFRQWRNNLPPNEQQRVEEKIRHMAGEEAQKELIHMLANADAAFFRKHWAGKVYLLNDSEFKTIQKQLRQVWDPDTPTAIKNRVLSEWLQADKKAQVVADWDRGQMWVNSKNLPAQLVAIMLSRKDHLAVCQNPECLTRYFVAPKKGRRYCEQGPCTAYAQRKYARESWQRKHGKSVQPDKVDVA